MTPTDRAHRRPVTTAALLAATLLALAACRSDPAPSVVVNRAPADAPAAAVPSTDVATTTPFDAAAGAAPTDLAAGHPRLWVTSTDVARLRSWATPTNPAWNDGLAKVADRIRADVDTGHLADDGSAGWVEDPVESDAEVLAFASLVEPDAAVRDADRRRARTLLMRGIGAAAHGEAAGKAYRDPAFPIDDRSRWWGEGWALTVDWIYPALSVQDKREIRTTFLAWAAAQERGGQTTGDHPVPVGAHDDPSLVGDPTALAWSANNYFTAHGRNIALMSLALDDADDPDGALHAHLANAVGGFLAMTDAMLRTIGRGGAPAEGFEYGPQSLGYVAETLLALHTSGVDQTTTVAHARFDGNPFWDELGPWLASSLSPAPVTVADGTSEYQPAAYGDSQHYRNPDWIQVVTPLVLFDRSIGASTARADLLRWLEIDTVGSGAPGLVARIADAPNPADAISYFLLLDPTLSPPADPRSSLPTTNIAAGVGRVSARTDWGARATWLTVSAGAARIDHQDGDGLDFGIFRDGEWLTKERTGYDVATSDEKNSLSLQNDAPEHDDVSDYRHLAWLHGSQFPYVNDGPGRLVATSSTDRFVYASVDATTLYDSASEGSSDVVQATRDIFWLRPDVTVVYDRATTRTAGRFKRFELQLPAAPKIVGRVAQTKTASGQQLAVTSLLPLDAHLDSELVPVDANGNVDGEGQLANGEPMTHRLTVDATGGPADVRFLHVLQGLDASATAATPTLVTTTAGDRFDGAVVGHELVLFAHDRARNDHVQVELPAGVTRLDVTGLTPGARSTVVLADRTLTIVPGDGRSADAAGVLAVTVG